MTHIVEIVNCQNSTVLVYLIALFGRPLQNVTIMEGLDAVFECETETEISPVEWFKDGSMICNGIKNIITETLPGYKYRLTILNSSLQDSGNYSIKNNGIYSKAALDIKGNKLKCYF